MLVSPNSNHSSGQTFGGLAFAVIGLHRQENLHTFQPLNLHSVRKKVKPEELFTAKVWFQSRKRNSQKLQNVVTQSWKAKLRFITVVLNIIQPIVIAFKFIQLLSLKESQMTVFLMCTNTQESLLFGRPAVTTFVCIISLVTCVP